MNALQPSYRRARRLCALAVLLGACAPSLALSTIKVSGQKAADASHVHVERDGKPLPSAAAMRVKTGDTISTDADTTLVLRLGEARAVLMPSTKVSLGSIYDWFGRVFVSGWLQGKTKLVTAAVKGTQYAIEVDAGSGLTTISVLEGVVQVGSVTNAFPPLTLTAARRVKIPVDLVGAPNVEEIARADFNALVDAANGARDVALDARLVPDLTDEREADAEARLRQLGFATRRRLVVARSPDSVGLVADQKPSPGTATRDVELQIGRAFDAKTDKVLLSPPASAGAGSQLELRWTGPNRETDAVVLVPAGAPGKQYWDRLRLSARGGRATLRAPAEPGTYELRYLGEQGIAARASVVVTPATVTLRVPTTATAGSSVEATWTGPNRSDDLVHLVPVGTPDGIYEIGPTSTLPASLTHGTLQAPALAGEYEVRYLLAGVSFKNPAVLARSRITVTGASAEVVAATATCEAGANVELSWRGPNREHDVIDLVPEGTPDGSFWDGLRLAAKGGRGSLRAPADPGVYELRYVLAGSAPSGPMRAGSWTPTQLVIARSKLTVTAATASFSSPDQGEAGATMQVTWNGPKHGDDQVQLVPSDEADGRFYYDLVWPASSGSASVRLPATPGEYELRYRLGGIAFKGGVAARTKVSVTPSASAVLRAPASVRAGAELKLSWAGPRRAGDSIQLVPADMPDGRYYPEQTLAAEPGQGVMRAPAQAGEYELRYQLGGVAFRGAVIIGRTKLRIAP